MVEGGGRENVKELSSWDQFIHLYNKVLFSV